LTPAFARSPTKRRRIGRGFAGRSESSSKFDRTFSLFIGIFTHCPATEPIYTSVLRVAGKDKLSATIRTYEVVFVERLIIAQEGFAGLNQFSTPSTARNRLGKIRIVEKQGLPAAIGANNVFLPKEGIIAFDTASLQDNGPTPLTFSEFSLLLADAFLKFGNVFPSLLSEAAKSNNHTSFYSKQLID
jgi:hypothetical protein